MALRDRSSSRRTLTLVLLAAVLAGCGSSGAAETRTDPPPSATPAADLSLVRVPGDVATISEAVGRVAPGGVVLVSPGVYEEEVRITTPDVTLRGTDRNETVVDGGGVRAFGVVGAADGVRSENLTVRSTLFYGVLVTSVHGDSGPLAHGGPGYDGLDPDEFPPLERFAVDHVTATNNGLYGIYAFNARHGTITGSYASGSADSGFYVGQCEDCDILVSGNVAERNAIGFENANASDSLVVAGNRFSGNRIGMTLISSYQESFLPQRANTVVGNLLVDNTSEDSPAHALGGFGIGLAVTGGQRNEVVRNRVSGNATAGVLLGSAEDVAAEGNRLTGNVLVGNGVDLADVSTARAPSTGTCVDSGGGGAGPVTTLPTTLVVAGCADGSTAGPAEALPAVPVPAGTSFLAVPPPPLQPSLDVTGDAPAPLPSTVRFPDLTTFLVPDADLLADRSGTAG